MSDSPALPAGPELDRHALPARLGKLDSLTLPVEPKFKKATRCQRALILTH